MQISGIAVQFKPEFSESIRSEFEQIEHLEIHAEEGGKMVITIEERSPGKTADLLAEIERIEGVLLVNPVYIYDDAQVENVGEEIAAVVPDEIKAGEGA